MHALIFLPIGTYLLLQWMLHVWAARNVFEAIVKLVVYVLL